LATFSVAPAVGLSNSISQLKLSEAFVWHLSGTGSGLTLGGKIQESFGSGVFDFELGPKIGYDFAIIPDVGFYLSPTMMMGSRWRPAMDRAALVECSVSYLFDSFCRGRISTRINTRSGSHTRTDHRAKPGTKDR
jgi:hypothetical protein